MRDTKFEFGEKTAEYDFAVFNEREIRAAAGILFLIGFAAWMYAAVTDDFQPMRGFGVLFMIDMFLRLFVSHKAAPSMIIGRFVTRNQIPEWVDAEPKKTAWYIGFGMVVVACFTMGWLALSGPIPLALCGICISFLFFESAFGFCAGCWLHMRFSKTPPRLCSGGVCEVKH